MNKALSSLINSEKTVVNAKRIAELVSGDEKLIRELISYLDHEDMHSVQLSAWAFGHLSASNSNAIHKHHHHLTQLILEPKHVSVRRNILKVFGFVKWKSSEVGKVWDVCAQIMEKKTEPSSHHAYSMTVMQEIIIRYPELYHELELLVENLGENKSAAVKSRHRNIIKDLINKKIISH